MRILDQISEECLTNKFKVSESSIYKILQENKCICIWALIEELKKWIPKHNHIYTNIVNTKLYYKHSKPYTWKDIIVYVKSKLGLMFYDILFLIF